MKKIITLLALLSIVGFAQQQGTFTDSRDKKEYKTVKIGEQTWIAQNLDYHGEDGYLGLCYGDMPKKDIKNPENCQKYGRLYNWDDAMKTCPKGWHLPSIEEWQTLLRFAGGDGVAGNKLKAKSGWNKDGNGTDDYGFSALPGGDGKSDGSFFNIGNHGYWWHSKELNSTAAWYRRIDYNSGRVLARSFGKSLLYSVRCVQDTP